MRHRWTIGLAALVVSQSLAASALAQGLLVVVNNREPVPLPRPIVRRQPAPPASTYKIKELGVNARLRDQAAQVQVSQSFVNTGSRAMEVCFVFPLPYDGAVDQLTFMVDGKEYPARLLSAEEAREVYEQHIRRNQDPALLEWIGTGMFQTSVFPVPPRAERTVTLRYSQLLRKDHELTDFLFPLATAKYTSAPVEKVEIRASIESTVEIKNVYSPTHGVDVERPGPNSAVVSYTGKNQVPAGDFRLFYSVAKGELGASLLSYRPDEDEDGYFLLLASPQIKAPDAERPKKTVVCVFDRSGSMSGEKIDQAREALKFVLNNLRQGDLFNIIVYDSDVETFHPELERYDDDSRRAALGFAEGFSSGGSTNIHAALTTAMRMLKDSSRPNYVIFLTDGLPTVGERNESRIVAATEQANQVRARLLAFGVGYDVNSRLLDRVTRANFGRSQYVRPDEDIEQHVSELYNRISSPVMTDVAVGFEFDDLKVERGEPVRRVYPREMTDLFEGEQVVIVGRYRKPGVAKVRVTGRVADAEQEVDFPVTLVEHSSDQSYAFVARLWAMRRIGEIIAELDAEGKNEELIEELVRLSTEHGVLTPYTSFLADETADPNELAKDDATGIRQAGELLGRLGETEGRAGVAQRSAKWDLMEANLAWQDQQSEGGQLGTTLRDIDRDADVLVDAVQVIDDQILYKRGNVWYSFEVAKEGADKIAGEVRVITRFSDEYFDLIEHASPAAARALSRQRPGEEMMIHGGAAGMGGSRGGMGGMGGGMGGPVLVK